MIVTEHNMVYGIKSKSHSTIMHHLYYYSITTAGAGGEVIAIEPNVVYGVRGEDTVLYS